jgi:hypothetical protein
MGVARILGFQNGLQSWCCANFDLLLLYLKSLRCSWYLTLKGLPVCPVYFMLHSGHVSWYTPLLSYALCGVSCFVARRFSIVLFVVKAMITFVSLNSFVMNLVSFPMYVNLAHLHFRLSCFCALSSLVFFSQ